MLWHEHVNILACPVCKGRLIPDCDKETLTCTACRLAFPVREGIPVMLVEEAQSVAVQSAIDSIQ